ncbi:MAG: HAD family hydrolase [Vicinamibacterales bacterium]
MPVTIPRESVPSRPIVPTGTTRVRGVLFDLDGTLYAQRPLRAWMAAELAAHVARHPRSGLLTARVLRAYRHAQEVLRHAGEPYDATQQLALAATRSGVQRSEAALVVNESMFERPLKYLRRHRAPGVDGLLSALAGRGLRLGVLSDYAADRKLEALRIRQWFPDVWCAGDDDVRALKPSPRGFLAACARWRIEPGEALMVGDRADADGAGAAAAGMRAVIVGRSHADVMTSGMMFVTSLEQVSRVIDECS